MKRALLAALCTGLLTVVFLGCNNDDDDDDVFVGEAAIESELRVIHASIGAPPVDVYLNDSVAIQGLAYGLSSGYRAVQADDYTIEVNPAGTTAPVITVNDFVLELNDRKTIFAMGELATIQPIVADDARDPVAGRVTARFVHASPDAPAVDVKVNSGEGVPVFGDVIFTEVTEYVEVDPGRYVFVVTAAGDTTPVATYEEVELRAGTAYTIVALGTLSTDDEFAFTVRVFADNDEGDGFTDLIPRVLP